MKNDGSLPRTPGSEEIIIEGDAGDSTLIEENDASPADDKDSSSSEDSNKAIADSGNDCGIDTNERSE